jgi:hypothetical protein
MKAAVGDFTLAAVLNPGQTGLKSSPVAGKKTGDICSQQENGIVCWSYWERVEVLVGKVFLFQILLILILRVSTKYRLGQQMRRIIIS